MLVIAGRCRLLQVVVDCCRSFKGRRGSPIGFAGRGLQLFWQRVRDIKNDRCATRIHNKVSGTFSGCKIYFKHELSTASLQSSTGRSFGQERLPLTDLLKNILLRYPDGGQILKELIQNADDAGANEVKFLFDATSHGTDSLVRPGLALFQGPAIYCYNNSKFTEEDWEGIQRPMRSNKQNNPLKVGRFGIGFNSVYHITDLPSIVSGDTVAFLDPHEKYFVRGEPGQAFSISQPLLRKHFDQFAPFHRIFDCDLNQGKLYTGTLFRFPLRTQPSQLSPKVYTREMVDTLFDSFKNEASAILLFLKNVDSISLFEREGGGEIAHLYTAKISEKSRNNVIKKRQELIQDITVDWNFTVKRNFFQLEIEKTCSGKSSEKNKWFVANQVGTREENLIELAQNLNLLPWVGIAFPAKSIDTSCLGRIYCFLPLPPDDDCRTGLPVQVNGFFGLTDNRRNLKWPGPDCQNDDTARWNKLLLSTVGSKVYADLIVNMVQDESTNLSPEWRAMLVYKALPDFSRVRHDWMCILQPFARAVLAREIFHTCPRGNSRWIKLGEAIINRLNETKSTRQEVQQVVLRTLLSANQPIISLPRHVMQIIDQFHQISGWPTIQKITPAFLCKVLRSNFDFRQLEMTFKERLLVLEYALQDSFDLDGVPLLPLESLQFVKFEKFSIPSVEKIFIPSEKHSADLLPNTKHRLLYRNLSIQVQQKFHELGCSKVTQLHHPTAKDIKQLLWQNLPDDWSASQSETVTWNPVTNGHPSLAWLQLVWNWINENYSRHLGKFEGMPLIPISINPPTSMARLRLNSTVITREHPLCNERLSDVVRNLLLKSGCVVVEKLPSFIKHDQLLLFISLPNPPGILSVLTVAKSKVIKQLSVAPDNVRHQLCSILSRLDNISSDQASFIRTLPIFEAVDRSHFISCEIKPGNQRLVAPRNLLLPKQIRIFDRLDIISTCNDDSDRLLKKLVMRIESTAGLILIHVESFLNSGVREKEKDEVMLWIFERMDSLNQELPGFIQFICELTCIPTVSSKRVAPANLFDHSDELLKRLLKGNNEAFAADQFTEPIRRRKHDLQIRRRENLTAQDILLILNRTPMDFDQGSALIQLVNQRPQLLAENTADGRLLSSVLRELPWLPRVQDAPANYPDFMPWYDGINLCKPSNMYPGSMALLVGATVPVFKEESISSEVQNHLGMSSPHDVLKQVINQLHLAVGSWTKQTTTTSLILGKFEEMINAIYMYLRQAPKHTVYNLLESKCLTEWVWHGAGFTSPEKVALQLDFPKGINLQPYFFRLPNELFKAKEFLLSFGVKPQFTVDHLLDMLVGIKAKHDSGRPPSEEVMQDLNQCRAVLEWIVRSNSAPISEELRCKLLIPVQSPPNKLQLEPCNTCSYCDEGFLRRGLSAHDVNIHTHLIHKVIPDDLASRLRVPRLSSCRVRAKEVGITFKEAGQYEPLTTRLRNILQEYKEGVTIFKEIIQNADDARATKVHFVIDWRENPRERLLTEELAKCQGPALWAYNDAMFSDDDFENINKLAGETKKEDLDKVGRFGLGFNSVYHVTDVPSFLSGEHLVVFDPNMNHISKLIGGKMRGGGFMLSLADNKHVLSLCPDQFVPYNELFGCDMTGEGTFHFEGTLFRLPFRTREQAQNSGISKEPYTPDNVKNLIKSLKESVSTLLLFAQNVQEVRVFEIAENSNPKQSLSRPLINITQSVDKIIHSNKADRYGKGTILQNMSTWLLNSRNSGTSPISEGPRREKLLKLNISMLKSLLCEVTQDIDREEMWLVNSCAGGRSSLQVAQSDEGIKNAVIPLTGVAAKITHSDKHGAKIFPVTGEVFCFMPLSIESGFPIHVNGSFSIYSNRRRLWEEGVGENQSLKPFEAKWNEALMEDAFVQAYLQLLRILTSYNCPQYQVDFHSLWPNPTKVNYLKAWKPFLHSFFNKIIDEEWPLFYCNGDWRKLQDCFILDPKLNKVTECAVIMEMFGKNILSIPQDFREAFKSSGREAFIKRYTLTENRFLREFLFPRITQIPNQLRNSVLVHILDRRLKNYRHYDDLLQSYPSFCCSEDGTLLRKPCELVHRKGKAACLFTDAEKRFLLDDRFLERERVIMLEELGMVVDILPWCTLCERAERISTQCDVEKARLLIQYMNQIMPPECEITSTEAKILRAAKFLPVLPKPKDYPFSWKSDECCMTQLADADHLYLERHKFLVGSSQLILDESPNCETPNKFLKKILGLISKQPELTDIIAQLDQIINPPRPLSRGEIETLCATIYEFLEKIVTAKKYVSQPPYLREQLECRPWLLVKDQMVDPKHVAQNWNKEDGSPYLFSLPFDYKKRFMGLVCWFGIKEEFLQEDFIEAISQLRKDTDGKKLTQKQIRTLIVLLEEVQHTGLSIQLPLPSEDCQLYNADELVINETPWYETDGKNKLVHYNIPAILAYQCGAKELRKAELISFSEPIGEPFGQYEKLTDRLKTILQAYPPDEGILKELLQNADDAKASEIHFVFDPRTHGSERIFSNDWNDLQGPAICVYNDKPFSKEDIEGIQKLGIGSKVDDPAKTGRYGIGFNAVYHLTDCPYFISNDEVICVFDPHTAYVPEANGRFPGRLFNQLNGRFRKNFKDFLSGFLADLFDLKGSTMFRFPLRRKAKQSEISTNQWSDKKVRRLFNAFRTSAKDMLLFLNNVTKISISEINNGQLETYSAMCEVSDVSKRTEFLEKIKTHSIMPTQQIPWQEIHYVMKISDTDDAKMDWMVTQSLGFRDAGFDSPVPNGSTMGLLPRAGIATRLPSPEPQISSFRPYVFCTLPLPVLTKFPAHINGHFAIDSTRRGLWHDHKSSDMRVLWNNFMKQRVIAPAYASAIYYARKHILGYEAESSTTGKFPSKKETEDGLRWYSQLYPSIKDLDAEWKPVGEALYRYFLSDDHVLPVTTSIPESKKPSMENLYQAGTETDQTPVSVTWCKMRDVYFCISGMSWSLQRTLLDIGFPLLSHTSSKIHDSFKAVESYQDANPEQVRKFLRVHQGMQEYLPRNVEDTILHDVNSVNELTKYCARAEDFFENLEGLPLLLTRDGIARFFRSNSVVFCSKFSQLLPCRPDLFLHEVLQHHYARSIGKCAAVMREFLMSDLAKFQAILFPSEWINSTSHQAWKPNEEDITAPSKEWLVLLWEFIYTIYSKVENKNVLEEIVNWHIIPTTHDCLVPLSMGKTVLDASNHLSSDSPQDKLIRALLVKLGCPQLNEAILTSPLSRFPTSSGSIEVRRHYLAFVQSTEDVLTLLDKTLSCDQKSDIKLKNQEIERLLMFLQSDLSNLSQSLLRRLPFYQTILNAHTRLPDDTTVYEVPSTIPRDDLEFLFTTKNSIFLSQAPKLEDLYKYIGIKQASSGEFYTHIVLKHFSNLTPHGREIHLKYVRDKIQYQLFDDFEALLSALKRLPFIPDQSGILRPAKEFYDPDVVVFKSFVATGKFPHKPFDSKEWNEFLKKLGLQCAVTEDHFLQYAKQLEREAHNVTDPSSAEGKEMLQKADVLVSHLFGNKSLQAPSFLSQISKIRFVPAATTTELYLSIYPPHTRTILTCFEGSVIESQTDVVWSSASLIANTALPYSRNDLAKVFGIYTTPPHEAVISHVKNISSRFPSANEKEVPSKLRETLSDVMTKIYNYFRKSCCMKSGPPKEDCSPKCRSTTNTLRNVPVILIDGNTFVCGSQLAFHGVGTRMNPHIFKIPRHLQAFEHFLKCLGAQEHPTPLQYSAVLEAIKRGCGDNPMHPGEIPAAVEATKALFTCFSKDKKSPKKRGSSAMNAAQSLRKVRILYFPTEDNHLMPSYDVFVNDIMEKKERLKDYWKNLLIDLTMKDQDPPPKLVELLPSHLKVKKLSSILNEELSPGCTDKRCILDKDSTASSCDFIKRYRDVICSRQFSDALIRLYKFQQGKADIPGPVKNDLRSLEENVKVLCIQNIEVRLVKVTTAEPVPDSESEVSTFCQKNSDGHGFSILIKHGYAGNSGVLHEKLSSFISKITGQHIHEATWRYLMMILDVKDPSEISKTLNNARVPRNANSPSREPYPGDEIPDHFHDLLKNDINYHLRVDELIGYEKREENEKNYAVYLYAKIIEETSQGNGKFAFNSKYKIDIGKENPITVSKLKLYKFDRRKRKVNEASSSEIQSVLELVPYEGDTGDSRENNAVLEPETLEKAKREVKEALKEIWQLQESQRSSAIKRLIRRWHPDKNKDRESFAEEVMKFLLNEVERLNKGRVPDYRTSTSNSNEPSREPTRGPSRGPSGSGRDASDYEEYFTRYRRRRERLHRHDWQESDNEEEPANENEARRWMRQARKDLEAAACLIQSEHFSFACFHCQQAVEKALKALMFAKGRLKKSDLTSHDIIEFSYRATRIDESLQAIPDMVLALHDYYTKTRYPHYQRGSVQNNDIPADREVYLHEDAENAISKAEEILQLIQQVLD